MYNLFSNYRNLFPILKDKVQLSSCSQSAIATPVSLAIEEYHKSLLIDGMDWGKWMEVVQEAKQQFAMLIGAEVDEVAITSSVSEAISAIVTALSYKKGKNQLVTTEIDFPTVGHIFLAQQKYGAEVIFIPSVNNEIPIDFYEKYITEKTILTTVSHVSYYNGFKQDLNSIANIVHEKGSLLLVDAYQSAGSVPIDVKATDIDILVAGAQKYLLGVPGIAFVYMKKNLANQLEPRVTGWFGQENPFAFQIKNLNFADGVRRFETGTPPVVNAYAANAAIKVLHDAGLENVYSYLEELSRYTVDYGQEKGLQIASPVAVAKKNPTTAFKVGDGTYIESQLKQSGIIVSARHDVIRIAPHLYNTKDDIKMAVDLLQKKLNNL